MQGQISVLRHGVLSFGLPHYASSEFELLAEELLMSDSEIKVSVNLYLYFCMHVVFYPYLDGNSLIIFFALHLRVKKYNF